MAHTTSLHQAVSLLPELKPLLILQSHLRHSVKDTMSPGFI